MMRGLRYLAMLLFLVGTGAAMAGHIFIAWALGRGCIWWHAKWAAAGNTGASGVACRMRIAGRI